MKPPRRRTEPQFRCHPHLQVHLAANRIIKHFIQKYKKALKMLKILF